MAEAKKRLILYIKNITEQKGDFIEDFNQFVITPLDIYTFGHLKRQIL